MVLFVSDYIISMFTTFKLKNKINKIKKDNTEEFNNKIKEIIDSKFLNRRIFSAFPKFKINIIKIMFQQLLVSPQPHSNKIKSRQ
jgi:hypothetical protein